MIWSLIMDIVLAGLLVATIVYCYRLNKMVAVIRDGREELEKLIGQFVTSTERAEESIAELKKTSTKIADKLQVKIEKAEFIADDLAFMIERGGKLSTQLGNAISGDSEGEKAQVATASSAEKKKPADNRGDAGIGKIAQKTVKRNTLADSPPEPSSNEEKRGRSQAEEELLKALKSIR